MTRRHGGLVVAGDDRPRRHGCPSTGCVISAWSRHLPGAQLRVRRIRCCGVPSRAVVDTRWIAGSLAPRGPPPGRPAGRRHARRRGRAGPPSGSRPSGCWARAVRFPRHRGPASSDEFAELAWSGPSCSPSGPGCSLPLEQEVARDLAAGAAGRGGADGRGRRSRGGRRGAADRRHPRRRAVGPGPAARRRSRPVPRAIGATPPCSRALSRGVLAGTGRFGRYGAQLSIDGCCGWAAPGCWRRRGRATWPGTARCCRLPVGGRGRCPWCGWAPPGPPPTAATHEAPDWGALLRGRAGWRSRR